MICSSSNCDCQLPLQLNGGSITSLPYELHWVCFNVLIVDDYLAGQILGMPQSMLGKIPGMSHFVAQR